MEAQCQRLQIRNQVGDRVLFTADEDELLMTTNKFTVTGKGKQRRKIELTGTFGTYDERYGFLFARL